MMKRSVLSAVVALSAGVVASLPAAAVTQSRNLIQTGADMCTLSIPTTDTKVRPKATGFRNEGTTSAFVICAFDSPPGGQDVTTDLKQVALLLKSLDGGSHSVTCTGVNSVADGELVGAPPQQFVAKTVTVNDTGPNGTYGVIATWSPADFGAAPDTTIPFSAGLFTITCNLPPQVSIKIGGGQSSEDVGN